MYSFSQYSDFLYEKLIMFSGGASYGQVVFMAGGGGCLAAGTPILMHNGSIKTAEDIVSGDLLMGPDGSPRVVGDVITGEQETVRVTSTRRGKTYEQYVSNRSHIHSFVCSYDKNGLEKGKLYDMTFDEVMSMSPSKRKALCLYKSPALPMKGVAGPVDPYILGLWLGDGCGVNTNITISNDNTTIVDRVSRLLSDEYQFNRLKSDKPNCANYSITTAKNKSNPYRDYLTTQAFFGSEKRIPNEYLLSSIEVRTAVLEGLLDSDGYNNNGYYEIITKFDGLKDDLVFLARSLGYAVSVKKKTVEWCYKGQCDTRTYHRVFLSGDFSNLNLAVDYKKTPNRQKNKNPRHFNWNMELGPVAPYYGFNIVGEDKRFLLGDFTVTHNSGKGFAQGSFMEGGKFKTIDVDAWKEAFLKLDAMTKKYPEVRGLKLKNPDDVFKLHKFVKDLGIKNKTFDLLFAPRPSDRLPNIIFDITFKEMNDVTDVLPRLEQLGYESKNIHLVWVLTKYTVAVARNRSRSRVVPDDVLLQTHEGAAESMFQTLKGNVPKGLDGSIKIILNNQENTVFWTDDSGKKIVNKRVERVYDKESNEWKDETVSSPVVKSFAYLTVKEPGKPLVSEKALNQQVLEWITANIPKTEKTASIFTHADTKGVKYE